MSSLVNFGLLGQSFLLTASRTIFWEEESTLVLSDLHLGKSGHFRKSGIAVPQTVFKEDMHRLMAQLQFFKPKQLLVVGDLFHSGGNKEHELFLKWRNDVPSISIQLVKGNHDILPAAWYQQAGIDVHDEAWQVGDFLFTHDINSCKHEGAGYCFSGHVHPGIRMHGLGRQTVRLACFYFGREYAILPAFGKFTGTYIIEPRAGDHVFALVENNIMQIQ